MYTEKITFVILAPKPGVWSPGQSSAPSAPAPRPFNPPSNPAPPPAASMPRAPPAKPSGVGAVRGKIGDAVVKKNETGLVPVCASCGSPIR